MIPPSALREATRAPRLRHCCLRRASCRASREHHRRRLARAVQSSGARAERERPARGWWLESLPCRAPQSIRVRELDPKPVTYYLNATFRKPVGGVHSDESGDPLGLKRKLPARDDGFIGLGHHNHARPVVSGSLLGVLDCQRGWSKTKTDLSRGGVMIETQHPTKPDWSFHRARRWN